MIEEINEESDFLTSLMLTYGEEIKRLVYSYLKDWALTEDVTQDVFVTIYLKLDSFQGNSDIKTWIYRIAINKCKDMLKSWKYKKLFLTTQFFSLIETKTPEFYLINGQQKDKVVQAIFDLPIKYREVIILYYYKELKINEISSLLGLSPSGVKTRLLRAKKTLEKDLGGLWDEK